MGNETSLDQCLHTKWGQHNCKHEEDVSVICHLDRKKVILIFNSVKDYSALTHTAIFYVKKKKNLIGGNEMFYCYQKQKFPTKEIS